MLWIYDYQNENTSKYLQNLSLMNLQYMVKAYVYHVKVFRTAYHFPFSFCFFVVFLTATSLGNVQQNLWDLYHNSLGSLS